MVSPRHCQIRFYLISGTSFILGKVKGCEGVLIYMHTMHAWLAVQMLWQMHGRTLQAVHMLIVWMGIF